MEDVGSKIGEIFTKHKEQIPGLSFNQISDALAKKDVQLSTMHVYRIHAGVVGKPSFQDVIALADFYQLEPNEIAQELGMLSEQKMSTEAGWKRNLRVLLESFLGQASEEDGKLAGQLIEVLIARLRGVDRKVA